MIAEPKTNTLPGAVLSGVVYDGLRCTTRDGKPARLAVLDEDGNIIAEGREVEREAWNVTLLVYRQFLQGQGHLRVHAEAPGRRVAEGND